MRWVRLQKAKGRSEPIIILASLRTYVVPFAFAAAILLGQNVCPAGNPVVDELSSLAKQPPSAEEAKQLAEMLERYATRTLQAANRRETDRWRAIKAREQWESYRDAHIRALLASLGPFPEVPVDLH